MEKELAELVSTTLQSELLTIALVTVLIFAFKDFASNLAIGLSFKYSGEFNEGDKVILDGEHAVIVDIGWRMTKFQFQKEGKIIWRFVPNTRIPFLNLSKIIDDD
jgi:small-conductance mechanosensitive channel